MEDKLDEQSWCMHFSMDGVIDRRTDGESIPGYTYQIYVMNLKNW